MKHLRPIGTCLLLLLLGVILGRELFPIAIEEPESEPPPRTRDIKKKLSSNRTVEPVTPQGPVSDTAGLLKLFIDGDAFNTSTRLRAALAEASASDLEVYLQSLSSDFKSDLGFHTVRTSLLNHLIAKDAFRAFDAILAHKDPQFQLNSISSIIQGIALLDPEAAREAVSLIDKPALQQSARAALGYLNTETSSEFLLSLLEENQISGGQVISVYNAPFGNLHDAWSYHGDFPIFNTALSSPLIKLAKQDFEAAENYARSLEDPSKRANALYTIAQVFAQKDPQAALGWAQTLDPSDGREKHVATVLGIMSKDDPQTVSRMVEELTSLQHRQSLINTVSSNWIQQDPDSALAWINTLPASQAKSQAISQSFRTLVHKETDRIPSLLNQLPASTLNRLVPELIHPWVNKDLDAAKQWITSQDSPYILERTIPSLLSTWSRNAPEDAAAFLQNSPHHLIKNTNRFFSTLAREWAISDPQAALNWAKNLESPGNRDAAINQVYRNFASSDTDGAIHQLSRTTEEDQRHQLISSIASNLSQRDTAKRQQWLSALPRDERFLAANTILSSLRSSQPDEAAALFDQLSTEASGDEKLLSKVSAHPFEIAKQWSEHAPENAAAWAENITDEDLQFKAISGVARSWATNDAEEAAQWIDQLPIGKPRDGATESFVDHVERIDPESAFEWAQTISDDERRFQSLNGVFNNWHQQNPVAAKEAINSASVTKSQREHFLSKFK